MKIYKTVLLPIEVPIGDYCWGGHQMRICSHFDNEGGHPTCDLHMDFIHSDKKTFWVEKPDKCKRLKEV